MSKANILLSSGLLIVALIIGSFTAAAGAANSGGTAATNSTGTNTQTSNTALEQQHLKLIQTRGDAEIARRLSTLNSTLIARVNATTKLSAADKSTLLSEVNSTIAGLNSLKTQLDSETSLAAAKTDVQNIFTEYRVYAVVAPKVHLTTMADGEMAVEAKLATMYAKIMAIVSDLKAKGKDTTAADTALANMNTQIINAQSISSNLESKVMALQPSDYNTDHNVLSGVLAQLKQAHADNQAAFNDAKTVYGIIKNLK